MAGSLNPLPIRSVRCASRSRRTARISSSAPISVFDSWRAARRRDLRARPDTGHHRACLDRPGGTAARRRTVAELDVSSDGSRVLIGKKVGRRLLTATSSSTSTCMSPASPTRSSSPTRTTASVFNGMTSDGTKVFFTTADQLGDDTDTSVDLYRADVGTAQPGPGHAGLDRDRRRRQHRRMHAGHRLERDLGGPANAARRLRRGCRRRRRRRHRLLRQSGAARRCRRTAKRARRTSTSSAPGLAPHFVGTIDSSASKPAPAPPVHPS